MTDREALLLAIARQPGEDTPRLALADWLDENGGEVDRARAEFIRVQAELAKTENMWLGGRSELRTREDTLLRTHEAAFRRSAPCLECKGDGKRSIREGADGWVDCPACYATGDVGGLLRGVNYHISMGTPDAKDEPVRVTEWSRGFPAALAVPRLSDVWAELRIKCPYCKSLVESGYDDGGHCAGCGGDRWITREGVTPWIRAVCRWHPVTSIVPLDRVPVLGQVDDLFRFDSWGNLNNYAWNIPKLLLDAMEGRPGCDNDQKTYPTSEAATLALGTALATMARKEDAK